MRTAALFTALALGCGLSAVWCVRAEKNDSDSRRIQQLITHLGSNKYAERDEASKALAALGGPALGALKQAAISSDLEVKRRALALIKKIEARLETDKLLAATRLRLKVRDVKLTAALQELARLSGHSIELQGPPSKFASRTISLDTGETTFWQALDALCQQAELSESSTALSNQRLLVAQGQFELEMQQALLREAFARAGGVIPPPAPAIVAPRVAAGVAATARGETQTFTPGAVKAMGVPVVLVAGGSDSFTCYSGAVRTRVTPRVFRTGDKDEAVLTFDVGAEPTLQALKVRNVRIERAKGDEGESLTQVEREGASTAEKYAAAYAGGMPMNSRQLARDQAVVHLRQTAPRAALLKELQGTIAATIQTSPEALITVNEIDKAVGKTIHGPSGGSIKLNEFTVANGQIKARLELEVPANPDALELAALRNPALAANLVRLNLQRRALVGVNFGGQALFSTNMGDPRNEGLTLYDEKDRPFPAPQMSTRSRVVNNVVTQEYIVSFRPGAEQGAPSKLVYKGSRWCTVEIPFAFRDLKLQ